MADTQVKIRKYAPEDKQAVRDIAVSTAFMGRDAGIFFADQDILADALTLYFTDYEPESCFVAESMGSVVGYIIGARDEKTLNAVFSRKIVKYLMLKAIKSRVFVKKKNIFFLSRCLFSFLRAEFIQPDFSSDYPAILHINLKDNFRAQGLGMRLIAAYLDYLRENKVKGVHLATMSDEAGNFFQKQGFNLLFTAKRSYFRHILYKDINVYIYGKRL
ncbi:MAG: GNAT family N-acetyltransferase [Candidatus Omnitrophica bacterium]|nr:GNAT family N-acetyltransferase [Candidatus Omnitrophota bacterium]